jgi:transposase-like protein
MNFFSWWLEKKESQEKRDLQTGTKNHSLPQQQNEDSSVFSHIPPLSNPNFVIDDFSSFLKTHLQTELIEENARQRSLEAIRIAESNSSLSMLNEDNRASAILSLIGKDEAMVALRAIRWRTGLYCPRCGSKNIKKTLVEDGVYYYCCLDCEAKRGGGEESTFNDLTHMKIGKDFKSVIRWILICYLKMFCSIGKISKILGMSLDETLQLLSLINQDENFKAKKKEKNTRN